MSESGSTVNTFAQANEPELLPELVAQNGLESEWWYYHGHLFNGSREFGFHLVFFRHRSDQVRMGGIVPVRRISPQLYFAHFAISDISRCQFRYGQQRSFFRNAGAASDRFHVWMRKWSARGSSECHHLRASIQDVDFDLTVNARSPLVRHGDNGQILDSKGWYFSYPRMDARGKLVIDGESLQVSGGVWMDRYFGEIGFNARHSGWDWFGIQFDDGGELMVHRVRDDQGSEMPQSLGTFSHPDGRLEALQPGHFKIVPMEFLKSRSTEVVYPIAWQLEVPRLDADLQIEPLMRCNELDTRASTAVLYWEGPASVVGCLMGKKVTGRCFMELAGYHSSRTKWGTYNFVDNNLDFSGWIENELKLMLFGSGRKVQEQS